MQDVLTWCVSLFLQSIAWLSNINIVTGVSVLAFLAATFALGLFIRKFIDV